MYKQVQSRDALCGKCHRLGMISLNGRKILNPRRVLLSTHIKCNFINNLYSNGWTAYCNISILRILEHAECMTNVHFCVKLFYMLFISLIWISLNWYNTLLCMACSIFFIFMFFFLSYINPLLYTRMVLVRCKSNILLK